MQKCKVGAFAPNLAFSTVAAVDGQRRWKLLTSAPELSPMELTSASAPSMYQPASLLHHTPTS